MSKLNTIKKGLLSAALLAALLVPIAAGVLRSGSAIAQDETDILPLVRIAPDYPPEASAQRLEGHVVLEFTVTAQGTTKDISVVESTSPIFEEASINALGRWRYSPRMIDGAGVDRPGTRTIIRFALERDEPAAGPENPPTPGGPVVVSPDAEAD